MVEYLLGGFESGFGDDANQVINAKVGMNRLVESTHSLDRNSLASGMRIDHQRVAAGDHAHGIARDGGKTVRYGRDGANDSEGGMFNHGQTVVAAENFAPHELDARGPPTECFELLDLVLQATDLGFFHLHCSQLDTLVDGNAADVIDDPATVVDGPFGEPLECLSSRDDRFIDTIEYSMPSLVPATGGSGRSRGHLCQHFLDDTANQRLGSLHNRDVFFSEMGF